MSWWNKNGYFFSNERGRSRKKQEGWLVGPSTYSWLVSRTFDLRAFTGRFCCESCYGEHGEEEVLLELHSKRYMIVGGETKM